MGVAQVGQVRWKSKAQKQCWQRQEVAKATKSAQEAVEKAGGKIEFIEIQVAPLEKGVKKDKAKEDRKTKKAKAKKDK